ncbi:hypothetical protein V4V60_004079 [Vibrio mimicus]
MSFQNNRFYIFCSGIASGVVACAGVLLYFQGENYVKKEDALTYLTKTVKTEELCKKAGFTNEVNVIEIPSSTTSHELPTIRQTDSSRDKFYAFYIPAEKSVVTSDDIILETDYSSSPTPDEIYQSLLKSADQSLYKHQDSKDVYSGIKVKWKLTIHEITKENGSLINVMSLNENGTIPWVYFSIDLERYPVFKTFGRGEVISVLGTIHATKPNEIKLKKVKLLKS